MVPLGDRSDPESLPKLPPRDTLFAPLVPRGNIPVCSVRGVEGGGLALRKVDADFLQIHVYVIVAGVSIRKR
jgi:hypothetical protein